MAKPNVADYLLEHADGSREGGESSEALRRRSMSSAGTPPSK